MSSFWDFKESLNKKPAEAPPGPEAKKPLTVSQLTLQIERALKSSFPSSIAVRGEISNFKAHGASGHLYFTLKDTESCIDCVMFRSDAMRLKFKPADGLDLVATGRVGVYGQRGKYQFYVSSLSPIGQGALELARQQIEARLRALGLFDAENKKPIPRYPRRIVLVTSQETAALQDMLKVLRRFPFLELSIYHVPVQGGSAAPKIAAALKHLHSLPANSTFPIPDLILLSRGGGSLEDLWAFNEEIVARAVAGSSIPIITGIGHEIDVSIADLAADYHAHTPTEAAQIATRHWRTAADGIDTAALRLRRETRSMVAEARRRLLAIQRHELFRRPMDVINQLRQRLDDRQQTLSLAVAERLRIGRAALSKIEIRLRERHPRHLIGLNQQRLSAARERLAIAAGHALARQTDRIAGLSARLEGVNPEMVLKRGYSMTLLKKGGQIIRDPEQVKTGDTLITRLGGGQIESIVVDARQLRLFE